MQGCVWIVKLLEHRLLRGTFVPPTPIRELPIRTDNGTLEYGPGSGPARDERGHGGDRRRYAPVSLRSTFGRLD